MTHDELLDKIEKTLGSYISTHYGSNKNIELRVSVIDSLQALRAVVELHKPEMYVGVLRCGGCEDMPEYPCPTMQAIMKELR